MEAKLAFTKRALIVGGLLMGTAAVALAPSTATARNLIGVDVGPLSVGIGSSEPDSDTPPPPPPAPSTTYVAPSPTYAAPSTTYVAPSMTTVAPSTTTDVEPAPQNSIETVPMTSQAPPAANPTPSTETSTTTYYGYPNEAPHNGYQPGLVPKGSETETIYYPR